MKIVLFCENKYAIGILHPLELEAQKRNYKVKWYLNADKINDFKYKKEVDWTFSMQEIYDFSPDAIFVPGNIVPYYLPGIKISIFHGYAAEKRGHFKIRGYFDLYFTQGPYFTKGFNDLHNKKSDFKVVETGWPKQDWIFAHLFDFENEKKDLLEKYNANKIVLYAPTFSERFTSLEVMDDALIKLSKSKNIVLLFKFHPLTSEKYVNKYKAISSKYKNIIWIEDPDIAKYQLMSDLMISDTSSTVYEFLLLNKPVITLNTSNKKPSWINIDKPEKLLETYDIAFTDKKSKTDRKWFIENYDPYFDGNVCNRMYDYIEKYKKEYGIPSNKSMNIWRRHTCIKTFGKIKTKK